MGKASLPQGEIAMNDETRSELGPGSITATCGHKLRDDEAGVPVYYKDQDCGYDGFKDVLVYAWFCEKCEREWRERGDLFASQSEADAWLRAS